MRPNSECIPPACGAWVTARDPAMTRCTCTAGGIPGPWKQPLLTGLRSVRHDPSRVMFGLLARLCSEPGG